MARSKVSPDWWKWYLRAGGDCGFELVDLGLVCVTKAELAGEQKTIRIVSLGGNRPQPNVDNCKIVQRQLEDGLLSKRGLCIWRASAVLLQATRDQNIRYRR